VGVEIKVCEMTRMVE